MGSQDPKKFVADKLGHSTSTNKNKTSMGRILKIISVAVVLFLGYLWVSMLLDASKKQTAPKTPPTEIVEDSTSSGEIIDDFENIDDFEENTETIDYSDSEKSTSEPVEKVTKNKPAPKPPKETTVSIPAESIDQTPVKTTSSPSGRYMVIVGSFLLEENADKRVNELKALGYPNAERVIFNLAQYHSVCAARKDSYEAAEEVAKAIRAKGLECYIHTKK